MRFHELLETAIDRSHVRAAVKLLVEEITSGNSNSAYTMMKWDLGIVGDDDDDDDDDDIFAGKPGDDDAISDVDIERWCESRVWEALGNIEWRIKNGTIRCWRVIAVPEGWKPNNSSHPGIYWSWDQSAAEAHWADGKHDHRVEIEADLPVEAIEWPITLMMNAHPDYEDEKEIRIRPGSPVNVLGWRPRD